MGASKNARLWQALMVFGDFEAVAPELVDGYLDMVEEAVSALRRRRAPLRTLRADRIRKSVPRSCVA